ncbi:hypothetical protein J3Q64DRAFT_1198373 [Phycomyces blakesleeanus]|uniref:COX assembly mitochondrial protein n=2 Tax=Phycomyces blakesleeanus TaxID=4837 RepID=A0A162TKQ0_PHYB8|nr:hypothetical protein PHYBLDRAFT_127157 [Phycomyces blakesleeanus NRRL 1555(-)]OAD69352.1 hypothetical protein PHYBLDRAFT_127157 [Phycomyces blakesleeanus NRRL 1555(-)]|eukprot:XP_018287392.1 hypothetical protein PHYBLDRAFT_127157 [Phycomyces blakesleeanus NRRL 1555(-)]
MHPQLIPHKHEGCYEAIQALDECHHANSFNRFIGLCNDAKKKVDKCLKEEFVANRAAQKAATDEKRARMKKIWKEMEEPPAGFEEKSQ